MKRAHLSSPTRVCLFLTHRCNFRCDYCYVDSGTHPSNRELSLWEIQRTLDEIQALNVLRLRLYGGEPLLRNDIRDVLDLLKHYRFAKQLNTNGSLVTSEIAGLLFKANVGWVIVSLNGPRKVHEGLSGVTGCFDRVASGIQELKRRGIMVGVDFVLSKLNVDYFYETLRLVSDMNVDSFRILPLSLVGRAKRNMESAVLPYEEWSKFYLKLTMLKSQGELPNRPNIIISDSDCNPCNWNRYYPLPPNYRKSLLKSVWNIDLDNLKQDNSGLHCIGGISLCAIMATGEVYPCDQMIGVPSLLAGNIREEKLANIWNNSEVFKMLRNLSKQDRHGPCSVCKNDFCSGLNLGAANSLYGDILASDMNCIHAKELSR